MSTTSFIIDDITLRKMEYFYRDQIIENKNQYVLFVAKTDGCTITVYKSNKVVFQGSEADNEALIWSQQIPKKVDDYFVTSIGSDEVGTGDYFGPVCVVATYIDSIHLSKLRSLNIDDSKNLSDELISKVAPELFKILPYSLLSVDNEKYNEIMNKDMNLNKLKAILHRQAIINLINKINVQPLVIIDQFCEVNNFLKYTNDLNFTKKVSFHTKAESKFASVACASMMARYIYLNKMAELSKRLGITLQKGASNLVDTQGRELVKLHGKEVLYRIAKIHFSNTKKILEGEKNG